MRRYTYCNLQIVGGKAMLKRPVIIVLCLLLAVLGFWLFREFRLPPGIEPKGDKSETIAWLGVIGGVISLLTAVVGLVQKTVELRATGKQK